MAVHGYTKNYKLIKPEFNSDTWHDYEYENLDIIDAVLSAIYASGQWRGFWKNDTLYHELDVVIDRNTDTMYKVVVEHTTDDNVTFAEYMFNHPEYYQLWSPNNLAKDWAIKDDGLADNQDYSAKAYAIGGVGTETNNAKYYSEQASISANASTEQAAASAASATASYNSEQLALSHANDSASSAATSLLGAEQSAASATLSQEQAELSQSHAEYAADEVAGLETYVQEKQNEINISLTTALNAAEEAKRYAIDASGANIGDIFFTSRLDTELNGAVEANGGIYAVADFTGAQSVPALLAQGKLPYISMEEYESIVSANGSCRAWGWDNGDTFRVPTLKDVYLMAGQAETAGEFISESLPNHNHIGGFAGVNGNSAYGVTNTSVAGNMNQQSGTAVTNHPYTSKASESSAVYQDGAKVRPDSVRYRAMVQLATGATDEALITATSALQQLANKADKDVSVIDIPATSGTVTLADNAIYSGTMTDAMTFVLPTVTDATKYHQIKAMLYLPVVTIDWGTTHYIGGEAPDISEAGQYMIYWDYVPALSAWAVGCMKVV